MLTKRRLIVGKIEAVEGTKEVLANADGGILAINPKVDTDIKMNNRIAAVVTLSKPVPVPGTQMAKMTFRTELKGAGVAYSALNKPALGKYLRACGFAETVDVTVGNEKVTYAPASAGVPSMTISCFEDGIIKTIYGARGTAKFSGKVGEICYIDFEFWGVYDPVVDGAMLSPNYEGTAPPPLLSGNISIAAYQAIVSSFEIDTANAMAMRPSANSATGFLSALITDRNPVGKFDPEMVAVATHDFFGKWKSGASAALNIGAVGGTQYNRFKFTAPKVVYNKVGEGEREGLDVADTSFQLAMTNGDDELSVEFS